MTNTSNDPVFSISDTDDDMHKAIVRAQNEFDSFAEAVKKDSMRIIPVFQECLVKCAFKSEDREIEVEHLFLSDIYSSNNTLFGYIASEPKRIRSVKIGDVVQVSRENLTDWLYIIDGVAYGGYTIRCMWQNFSSEEKRIYGDKPPFCWITK